MKKTYQMFLIVSMLGVANSSVLAVNVAVIDTDAFNPGFAEAYCIFFEQNGHTCTAFPTSGPTGSLDPFDVVVDFSELWSDPDGLLANHIQKGKSVIIYGSVPLVLGIDTNPTVQAWIGANDFNGKGEYLITTETDPMLDNIQIGTLMGYCGLSACAALLDTTGHPDAKVLVNFADIDLTPYDEIAMLRNRWEGGQSVFISDGIEGINGIDTIILRAVVILGNPVPAVSTWGLVVMTLTTLITGTLVIRRKCANRI